MASNYKGISVEHEVEYGKGVGRWGQPLLADRYDDRTHFIYELLQNAEDALKRRSGWRGSRQVKFELATGRLTLSHFGQPFTEADVRSICSVAMSTKADDDSAIGKFGIGFKSVYNVTDRPEIHSGCEDFAIENFVLPVAAGSIVRHADETKIILPLKDGNAEADITRGLKALGPRALLFLRNIDEISWTVENGESGMYLKGREDDLDPIATRVKVIGTASDTRDEVDEDWLVFHRDCGKGLLEIAFSVKEDGEGAWSLQPVATSPLVVFFPTAFQTHLGFLIQGPFLTTPSRDNIKSDSDWNRQLVRLAGELLVEAMIWLRDNNRLTVSGLRCLPLDRKKFSEGSGERLAPIFESVREALLERPLLPRFDGGFVTARQAKLARTQELRELFNPEQVEQMFDSKASAWLTGDITPDRQPEIRAYVMQELGITEVTPAAVVPRLTKVFLEAQADDWVRRLYEFLGGQMAALRTALDKIPLIRLEDGTHVVAREDGVARAFLPSAIKTDFPTIRRAVCATDDARRFLLSLGVTEPDPVDDVIRNLLPKYQQDEIDVTDDEYTTDIKRIREAFGTDSNIRRERLLAELRKTSFVMAVDSGDGSEYVEKPGNVYIATERLQQLFAGVTDVLIVDSRYDCLRGEDIRDMLVSCGASRYLSPEKIKSGLGSTEKAQLRREAGLENASWHSEPEDFTLRGLNQFLAYLPRLKLEEAATRASLLWDALVDLEGRGTAAFYGSYSWSYYSNVKAVRFNAAFIETLNQTAWVPDTNGKLVKPSLVEFDGLGWKTSSFLLTRILFKPPIINQLAKAAGIDPAAIDLLRKHGITSLEDLASRLGIVDPPPEGETPTEKVGSDKETPDKGEEDGRPSGDDVYEDAKDLYGDGMPDIPDGTPDPDGGDGAMGGAGRTAQDSSGGGKSSGTSGGSGGQGSEGPHGGSGGHTGSGSRSSSPDSNESQTKRTPGSMGGKPFISYLGAHPNDEEPDPDGLDQAARMKIEDQAISLIVNLEPELRRTPEGNPGFDLFEVNSIGQEVRWVEVKSMTGSLDSRPVGLSRTQFDSAREKGDAYWLYVVEYATDPDKVRVLRIQNPVAHAKTFTFDRGWRQIAEVGPPGS